MVKKSELLKLTRKGANSMLELAGEMDKLGNGAEPVFELLIRFKMTSDVLEESINVFGDGEVDSDENGFVDVVSLKEQLKPVDIDASQFENGDGDEAEDFDPQSIANDPEFQEFLMKAIIGAVMSGDLED